MQNSVRCDKMTDMNEILCLEFFIIKQACGVKNLFLNRILYLI